MVAATARAPKPSNAKGRTVAVRPLTNQVSSNNTVDNMSATRVQFLTSRFAISAVSAAVLAPFIWGGARG